MFCFEMLRQIRSPDAVKCMWCISETTNKRGRDERQQDRPRYHCTSCGQDFDDLINTIFEKVSDPHHTTSMLKIDKLIDNAECFVLRCFARYARLTQSNVCGVFLRRPTSGDVTSDSKIAHAITARRAARTSMT